MLMARLELCILLSVFIIIATKPSPAESFAMTWKDTWTDILNGGPKRWKVDDLKAKEIALNHIVQHSSVEDGRPMRILCPLAGDDPFVRYAWGEGHDVTAIDVVPEALRAMREQFGEEEDWSSEQHRGGGGLVWKHQSGRVTLLEGDVLAKRPEVVGTFDAVYDKDSFGAITLDMRPKFCERISEFVREGGTLYVEVKNKERGRDNGPPFHVEKADIVDPANFGGRFEYVSSLGEVYGLGMAGMKQMGHVLRRLR